MDARSFTSRRPAAGALPAFTLPSPSSDIPRAVESISPSISGVNTGSSAASQSSPSMSNYNNHSTTHNYGHTHGAWQTPGNGAYQLNSGSSPQQPAPPQQPPGLGLSTLAPPRSQLYTLGSAHVSYPRDAVSPTEGLPAPPAHDSMTQPFPAPLSSNGGQGASQYGAALGHHGSHSNGSSSSLNGYSASQKPGINTYHLPSPISQSQYSAYSTMASPSQASPTGGTYGPGPQMPHKPGFPGYSPMSNGHGPILSSVQHSLLGGQHMSLPGYHGSSHLMYPQHAPHAAPAQDRPFRCHLCPQAFTRNHDLKRHKRIHLSVKPFPCDGCSKSFSRKDALKRHKLVKGCEQEKKRKKADSDSNDQDDIDHGDGMNSTTSSIDNHL